MLVIHKMPDGGFVIFTQSEISGAYNPPLFACTTIDEALKYIKKKLTEPSK